MQRRACKVESSMIIIMTMRMMELNVLLTSSLRVMRRSSVMMHEVADDYCI